MLITRTSIYSGVQRAREINVSQEQIDRWQQGTPIQRAMPQLSEDDREFILSGITPEEWDEVMGPDPDFEDSGKVGFTSASAPFDPNQQT